MTGFYTKTPNGHEVHINGNPDMDDSMLSKLGQIFDKAVDHELEKIAQKELMLRRLRTA